MTEKGKGRNLQRFFCGNPNIVNENSIFHNILRYTFAKVFSALTPTVAINMSFAAVLSDPSFLVKILPTITQFILSIAQVNRRLMSHVLRRDPRICKRLEKVKAVDLEREIALVPSLPALSQEVMRFQSAMGLALTVFNSMILSSNQLFRVYSTIFLVLLGVFYFMLHDSKPDRTPSKGFPFSLACTALGIVFVYVSNL